VQARVIGKARPVGKLGAVATFTFR